MNHALMEPLMTTEPHTWTARLAQYTNLLSSMEGYVAVLPENRPLSGVQTEAEAAVLKNLLQYGLIKAFNGTHELAWKLLREYARYQGHAQIDGSSDATREALSMGLSSNGEVWMDMIRSRSETSQAYKNEIAQEIYGKILSDYMPAFVELRARMAVKRNELEGDAWEA
jgi:nucleotidyltransferase substrate binding protein (TIGR01987 family)